MMEYKDIEKAVSEMQMTPIKGKMYPEVPEKVKAFRKVYPHGTISTQMILDEGGKCVFKAEAYDNDTLLGTGWAYEQKDSSYINKTSYIENCETSAVGRALSFAGFGGDKSISGFEEVANAINQQEEEKKSKKNIPGYPGRDKMIEFANLHYPGDLMKPLLDTFGVKSIDKATDEQLAALYDKYKDKI